MISLTGNKSGLNCVGRAKVGMREICAVCHQLRSPDRDIAGAVAYEVAYSLQGDQFATGLPNLDELNTEHVGLKVQECCEEAGFGE